jgi:hypothetical protein
LLGGQWKKKEKVLLLGGQWKEKGKFPMLGSQWKDKEKVPLFEGQWKDKEKFPFHLFPLSPQAILLRPLCFSFEIKVLFYHGYRPSFMHFLPFPWLINYNRTF